MLIFVNVAKAHFDWEPQVCSLRPVNVSGYQICHCINIVYRRGDHDKAYWPWVNCSYGKTCMSDGCVFCRSTVLVFPMSNQDMYQCAQYLVPLPFLAWTLFVLYLRLRRPHAPSCIFVFQPVTKNTNTFLLSNLNIYVRSYFYSKFLHS